MDICKDVSGCQSCILAKLAFTPFKYTVVAGKSTKRLVKNTLKINSVVDESTQRRGICNSQLGTIN